MPQLFTQTLDHTQPSAGTFPQRYYVNDTFYDPKVGLCFIEFGGEGPLNGPPKGNIAVLAQQYSALLVSLEHRFYGKSVPNNSFSVDNLKYLTVNQALDDMKNFMDFLTTQYAVNGAAPLQYFVIGGSYSGALSAWFKIKYPTAAVGALSSSGVVNAILEFTTFDEQNAISAGPACAASIRAITAAFDAEFAAGNGAAMKALFNAPAIGDDDFAYMYADSATMMIQYGNKAVLCDNIPSPTSTNAVLTAWFANLTNTFWGADFGSNCFYDTNCLRDDPSQWQPTSRAWRWQKCYELAYFQIAPATGSLRSQRLTLSYALNQCQAIFGIPNMMPSVTAINNQFGGPTPAETDVFYSNGSDDPWQRAAVNGTLSDTQPEVTAVCDGCGHCGDLETYANSPAVIAQREAFGTYVAKWVSATKASRAIA